MEAKVNLTGATGIELRFSALHISVLPITLRSPKLDKCNQEWTTNIASKEQAGRVTCGEPSHTRAALSTDSYSDLTASCSESLDQGLLDSVERRQTRASATNVNATASSPLLIED